MITVLGTGLPALLAVHAATVAGRDVQMRTLPIAFEKSADESGLFMAALPPQLTTTPYLLQRALEGSYEAYSAKAGVTGEPLRGLPRDHYTRGYAYDVQEVEDELQYRYSGKLSRVSATDLLMEADPELVINTYSRHARCTDGEHRFGYQQYWQTDYCRYSDTGPNTIVGSGRASDWWHTCFNLPRGRRGTWLPLDRKPNGGSSEMRYAPNGTTCTCLSDEFHVGRLATWDSEYPVENAYFDTLRQLVENR